MPLYAHAESPHTPENPNVRLKEEHAFKRRFTRVNIAIAVWLTAHVGTMITAYVFAALASLGLLGIFAILSPTTYTLVQWLSGTFIQLVLLPVIMVGQNVLNRKAELQADAQYTATLRLLHEHEQLVNHLAAQDEELEKQTRLIQQCLETSLETSVVC